MSDRKSHAALQLSRGVGVGGGGGRRALGVSRLLDVAGRHDLPCAVPSWRVNFYEP